MTQINNNGSILKSTCEIFRNNKYLFFVLFLAIISITLVWTYKPIIDGTGLSHREEITIRNKKGFQVLNAEYHDKTDDNHKQDSNEPKEDDMSKESIEKTRKEQKEKWRGNEKKSREEEEALNKEIENLKDNINSLKQRLENVQNQGKVFPEVKFLSYKDRKRILVTGGAGFVGSHLVDKLMLMGHEVTVADNFFTGRKRNVEQWIGHQNFELLNHDVINDIHIEVDRIYHLASPASPPHYMYNPIKTIKTNTIGTINMLGLAKRVKARLLFASTSEVYGDPEVHPQTEGYWGHVNPIGPRACYDEAKRVGETLCYAYKKQEDVEVRVARIFNTFGPRMHMNDGRVVSNFILQALQNQPMTVYGTGDQTRSFQYVTDLVDGLVALMESNYTRPVNIGNPDEHTIIEFAKTIKKLLGGQGKIVHKDPVVDDPQRRKPDISVAKKELLWSPKVPLMTGINKTIEYFKNELKRKKHSERNLWKPEYLKN